jgi:electron transport complex protein RnfG
MKETLRMTCVLTALCLAAGLLLAEIRKITAEPIEEAERAAGMRAVEAVLPPHDNDPDRDRVEIRAGGKTWVFFVATDAGGYAGAAFAARSERGYGGAIDVVVGVTAGNTLKGIEIVAHRETPGLGSKIESPAFRRGFEGRNALDPSWCRVSKDDPGRGGIDAVTGATISSRAVAGAVAEGLSVFRNNVGTLSRPKAADDER